ncbi:2OG-Fe(II) oxygenase [Algoriphagus sp. H41]|uniref:2OG-Fe(II) oxygenase n=1 Tax=Algoriphagus oliviformis TaxID=2811231 RepID=A0ABS3CDG6_9BACT|nr:2OG-Fe(II) oxygenase [Algoriphagus oliviformis]MBN7813684.1 2OG-Fe(II) oxygenase [Algoriphagus oliviformis]
MKATEKDKYLHFVAPFEYIIQENFLEGVAFRLLQEKVSELNWITDSNEYFVQSVSSSQSTIEILEHYLLSPHFDIFYRKDFIEFLSILFSTKLSFCSHTVFHQIQQGGFNAIHNDVNDFGALLRLILYISPINNYEGGKLRLHFSDALNTIATEYKFQPNSLFGFKISQNSYHSVEKVERGNRICMVVTYS